MTSRRISPTLIDIQRRLTAILSISIVCIVSLSPTHGSVYARPTQDILVTEWRGTVVGEYGNPLPARVDASGATIPTALRTDADQDGLDDVFDAELGGTLVEPIAPTGQEVNNTYDSDQGVGLGPNCIGGGLLLAAGLEERAVITTTRTISGTVWLDEDEDGLQPGVPITATIGITVTCDCYENEGDREPIEIATAVVDPDNGTFAFIVPHDYEVELSIEVPDGFGLTYQDVDNDSKDTIDSDFNPVTKKTGRFLASDSAVVDRDAGLVDGNSDPDDDGLSTADEDVNNDGDPSNDDSDRDGVPDYLDDEFTRIILLPIVIR